MKRSNWLLMFMAIGLILLAACSSNNVDGNVNQVEAEEDNEKASDEKVKLIIAYQ